MPVKVSVVVPVYNTGPLIDRLVHSLDEQTLPPGELEVVWVDDGSTDGTRARLAGHARTRPHHVVTGIPNSGWPGRPRNVGVDHARGEYVFFADHDDGFFPDALRRMYETAVANGADIVYGKVVRAGGRTPYWRLAARDMPTASLDDGLLVSRTIHKLYRRGFLTAHGIRFPEGRVRLEDHHFTAQALACAPAVSILASYPCYRWSAFDDLPHTSGSRIDPSVYWRAFAAPVEITEERAGPGELLDAVRVAVAEQAFVRLPASRYLRRSAQSRREVTSAVHDLVVTHLPPAIDPRVPVLKRLRLQALRDDDHEAFDELQRTRARLRIPTRLTRLDWVDGRLAVHVEASLKTQDGVPLPLARDGDGLVLPEDVAAGRRVFSPDDRRLGPGDRGGLEITIRHRDSHVEWPLACETELRERETGDGVALTATCRASVDPTTTVFGDPLDPGLWDLLVRVDFLGEALARSLAIGSVPVPDRTERIGSRTARVVRASDRGVALRVLDGDAPNVAPTDRPTAHRVAWRGRALDLDLDLPPYPEGTAVVAVRRRGGRRDREFPVAGRRATIELPRTRPGHVLDLYLRDRRARRAPDERVAALRGLEHRPRPPFEVYTTGEGWLAIVHERRARPLRSLVPRPLARLIAPQVRRVRQKARDMLWRAGLLR